MYCFPALQLKRLESFPSSNVLRRNQPHMLDPRSAHDIDRARHLLERNFFAAFHERDFIGALLENIGELRAQRVPVARLLVDRELSACSTCTTIVPSGSGLAVGGAGCGTSVGNPVVLLGITMKMMISTSSTSISGTIFGSATTPLLPPTVIPTVTHSSASAPL
jgi:hypothetical protein